MASSRGYRSPERIQPNYETKLLNYELGYESPTETYRILNTGDIQSFTSTDELGIINLAQMITNNKIKHQRSRAGQINIMPTVRTWCSRLVVLRYIKIIYTWC